MRRVLATPLVVLGLVLPAACQIAAGDSFWPSDRDDHEAIAQAAADSFLAGVLERVTDGQFESPPVSPLDISVWEAEFEAVDEELFDRYGLGVSTSVGDEDGNGLIDVSMAELTIFWMQRSDVRRERCVATVDFELNVARVAECTGI